MATITETVSSKLNLSDSPSTVKPREPLKLQGLLDRFESFDVTPVIGKEFPNLKLSELINAPNADDLIRELAITISQRGVVFFRRQDDLDNETQKKLAQRLGELVGGKDDEISVISSEQQKTLYTSRFVQQAKQSAREGWHSDITFEPVPSDYAILRLTELPKTGGDTLWASGYDLYDRISKPYRQFLEGLTATYAQPIFNESAQRNDFQLHAGPRGAPENVGTELTAVHPVVRTNPVTGWKSVYAVGHHAKRVNGVSEAESEHLLGWFVRLIVENHDLQVRLRWRHPNDVAIWDNRSVFHTATYDYEGPRTGQRAVGLGERPYLDPNSISRREALAEAA